MFAWSEGVFVLSTHELQMRQGICFASTRGKVGGSYEVSEIGERKDKY